MTVSDCIKQIGEEHRDDIISIYRAMRYAGLLIETRKATRGQLCVADPEALRMLADLFIEVAAETERLGPQGPTPPLFPQ